MPITDRFRHSRWGTAVLGTTLTALIGVVGCSDEGGVTALNPQGPPMVRQVVIKEVIAVPGSTQRRVSDQIAFGSHIDVPDEDATVGVNFAEPLENDGIRIVFDELLVANYLEEIQCVSELNTEFYSEIPVGTTPDDIDDCSPPDLSRCSPDKGICVDPATGEPVGIATDGDLFGTPADFRLIRYDDGELGVRVTCDGVAIPLDQDASFYNPSGNQVIPLGNVEFLGPALIVKALAGYRTAATCTLSFNPAIVDKDGIQICAPVDGNINADCTPGDTTLISWKTEAMKVLSNFPRDGDTNIFTGIGHGDGDEPFIQVRFNAAVDAASLPDITIVTGSGTPVTQQFEFESGLNQLAARFIGGFLPNETYTVTVPTTVKDSHGGSFPEVYTFTFTTADAPPPGDGDGDVI